MTTLSIIILSYNTKDLTLRCVESIIKQYKKEITSEIFEIVLVDNGSKDGSVEAIQDLKLKIQNESSKFKIIKNKKNFGFSKGCNIGARAASGDCLLFLNSDTEVLDGGFLKMVEFLDSNNRIGILGGKLSNHDGLPQASCGKFYTLGNLFLMLAGFEKIARIRECPIGIKKADWVSGACMMIKKSVFDKIGGFDENFFMYMEDMEICFRAKSFGLLTYFYPYIKLVHKEFGSSNKSFAIINIYKGISYFYSKHKNFSEYFIAKMLLRIKAFIAIFIGLLIKDSSLVSAYRSAIKF